MPVGKRFRDTEAVYDDAHPLVLSLSDRDANGIVSTVNLKEYFADVLF